LRGINLSLENLLAATYIFLLEIGLKRGMNDLSRKLTLSGFKDILAVKTV